LYWHPAPIFDADNYFGNPTNHWPGNIVSLMVLGIPSERKQRVDGLARIRDYNEWWPRA
jgi:hypothetical protein